MAKVVLPASLVQLFPDATRNVELADVSGTVQDVLAQLDTRWPGMRNRICDTPTSVRRHITIFVDSDQSDLSTPVTPTSEIRIIPAVSGG
jgi:sulfur-carrier protein